jgi:hypothetical protein
MKCRSALGLAALSLLTLATTVNANAEQVKLTEKCGPVLERAGKMNDGHAKPWTIEVTGTPSGAEVTFERATKDTPGMRKYKLASMGRGMAAFSGYWERDADRAKSPYAPVSMVAESFPVAIKTRYMMEDGFRECELIFSMESGRPLKVANVLKGAAPGTASAPASVPALNPQVAQNQQNIAANSARIDQNAAGVAQNRQDIGVNRQGIAQNQQNIAANQQEMKSRTTLVNEKYAKPVTGTAETWATYMSGVPFQQNQFCRIIQNWREELSLAQQQRNQIKENIAHRTREQRLTALMPDGNFQNWIVRAVSVKQASDGSAAVLFELPCDVVIGSHACGQTPKSFVGTIPENSRLYSELVSISVSDFLGVSGSFSFIDEKSAFKKDRSVASFTTMKAGTHCDAKDVAKPEAEFYASQVMTLSTLK